MRLEKLRKDEARREALRLQNEERKRLKAEAAKVRAQQRQVAEEEFRQTLVCALCPSISKLLCFCALDFFLKWIYWIKLLANTRSGVNWKLSLYVCVLDMLEE